MRFELIGLGIDYKRRRSATTGPVQGVIALLVLAAIALATAWSLIPPEPLDSDVWPDAFSAKRALADVEAIAGGGPHPTGSEEQDRVREYLVQRLKDMGYSPHVQHEWIRLPGWSEGVLVRNVLARLDSGRSGPALMVTAHYDSVHAGPGAMDDAAGVSVALQVAEALRGTEVRNPVVFLLSDGEEMGLLGARAFVGYHPWAEDVEVVLNLEARGTSGLSLMFETGEGNSELISVFGEVVERPIGSSAFYSLYKQLPVDTDFTVYKHAGMTGLNFGNIGTASNYHTAEDNLENVDLGTIQHLGDSALSLVRGLVTADLERVKSDNNSVFFDLFSRWQIRYSEGFAFVLTILGLAMSLYALSRVGVMQRESPALSLVAGSIGFVASAAVAFGAGTGAIALVKLGLPSLPASGFVEHHIPVATAVLSAVAAGALAGLAGSMRWSGLSGLWGGALIWWNAAAVAATIFLPGVSYLFALPVIASAAGLLVLSLMGPSSGWTYLVALLPGIVVTSILWTPYAGMLTLMGGPLTYFAFASVVLLASAIGPILVGHRGAVRWIPAAAFGLVSIVFVFVTYWLSV